MKTILIMLIMAFFILNAEASDLSSEVAETARLRQEVELLSHEVETLKKAQQAEMDVYIQRYQEVAAQVLKEQFRTEQLKTQIKLSKEKLENHTKSLKTKNSETWIGQFWEEYEASLKFAHPLYARKLIERLSKLKMDLGQKRISYEHALLQTWFILESDLTKSQEAEFILSPIQIKDDLHHVEMVRFGRNKGYFRTAEGKYGELFYQDDWTMKYYDDAHSQKMIETLLGQFKQQQKSGLYQLPGIKL